MKKSCWEICFGQRQIPVGTQGYFFPVELHSGIRQRPTSVYHNRSTSKLFFDLLQDLISYVWEHACPTSSAWGHLRPLSWRKIDGKFELGHSDKTPWRKVTKSLEAFLKYCCQERHYIFLWNQGMWKECLLYLQTSMAPTWDLHQTAAVPRSYTQGWRSLQTIPRCTWDWHSGGTSALPSEV